MNFLPDPHVITNRGLLLASHPTLLHLQPKASAAIIEHFAAKKHTLALQFANLIGSLLLLFGMRQGRPASGSMAALPFELLVQVIYLATESTFNVTQEQIYALLELISTHHAAIRERLRQKNAQLSLIERERAVIVNGKRTIRLQLDVWPPLS